MVRLRSLLLGLCAMSVRLAQAQGTTLELPRLHGPVTVDGVLNETAWESIPALPLTMYTPVYRGSPTQRTVLKVAYSNDAVYAACWCYDTQPSGIRVNSLYRDLWNGDDAVAIYLDAFRDRRNAKWFGVTAAGIRFDRLLSDDGSTENGSWDTFWLARTTRADSGWFMETRIPFSSIGFHAGPDGRVQMGLTVTRLVSRLDERVTFPDIDPKFEFRRPSLTNDITLDGVQSRRPVYVTPYVLGGSSRTLGAQNSYHRTEARETGIDIRVPITSDLMLDVTANTDFAQVEADDQQVNLDRFALFFPERRRFFQEGSGIFDFQTAGGTRLFNSRRIGLTSGGSPVPVRGGARLVGRASAWDVGALAIQTDGSSASLRESFGVFRVRRPILNRFSTAGLLVTAYDNGVTNNLALGGDAVLRVKGDEFLSLRAATSHDSRDSIATLQRSLIDLQWERRAGRGLQYNFTFSRAGRDYRPELGFMSRTNYTVANAIGNWFLFTDSSSTFRRIYPGALAFHTFRNSDGALESAQWAAWVQWDTKRGGGGWVEPKVFHENVATPFRIGKSVLIPAGEYDFADLQIALSMAQGRKLLTGVDFRTGTYFDGTRTQVLLRPRWNVSPHLELGGDYQLSHLSFPSRSQDANVQLARLRVRSALDARLSGNALVQYSSTNERLDFNARVRYAFGEGTDLWLVFNEGLDTDRDVDLVGNRTPRSLARTFIVKYTHTLAF